MNTLSSLLMFIGKNGTHPVGSYYFTSDASFDPNEKWVGEWERVEGKFLLGATVGGAVGTNIQGNASVEGGSTGGEAAHLLTSNEAAQKSLSISGGNHSHTINAIHYVGGNKQGERGTYYGHESGTYSTGGTGAHTHSVSASNASASHNNMPPFEAVYIWHRTA